MKPWETPDMQEVEFSATQYGKDVTTTFDAVYPNDDHAWEATFLVDPDPNLLS